MFKTIEDGLNKIETVVVCAGLGILIITVFAAAVLRFFGIDMSMSTDIAQLVFAWVSFIGADLAMRKDKHMGVDMLIKHFPPVIQHLIWIFNYILIFIFLAVVTYYGADLCVRNAARKYQTLYISYSFATVSCPIGCFLMAITSLKRIVQHMKALLPQAAKKSQKIVSGVL